MIFGLRSAANREEKKIKRSNKEGVMGLRAGSILLLLVVVVCTHANARNLATLDVIEKSIGSEDSKEITTNKQVCKLCEDFTSRVVQYFSANETQSDIISILHQACSHTHGFKHQCDLLVDHYAPLFFVKIATLQPELVCEKAKLCGEMVSVRLPKRDDACTVCHRVVAEVLTKLQDPDTQLEIIETLLKECGKVETFAQQCKKLVFEYGPIILVNAEKFLKTTDICVTTHVCKTGPRATDSPGLQTNVASA